MGNSHGIVDAAGRPCYPVSSHCAIAPKGMAGPEEGGALDDDSDLKGGDVMTQQEFYLLEFTGSE